MLLLTYQPMAGVYSYTMVYTGQSSNGEYEYDVFIVPIKSISFIKLNSQFLDSNL